MTTVARDYFDALGLDRAQLVEAAEQAGVALADARDSIAVLDAWHSLQRQRGAVADLPRDLALGMADAGLTDLQLERLEQRGAA